MTPSVISDMALSRTFVTILLDYFEENFPEIEVMYTTTTSLSLQQQQAALDAGFRILGIFPNLLGKDRSQINGLTAYFFPHVFPGRRPKAISLHPSVFPFFKIAARELGIEYIDDVQCGGLPTAAPSIGAPSVGAPSIEVTNAELPTARVPTVTITAQEKITEQTEKYLKETPEQITTLEMIRAPEFVLERFRSKLVRSSQLIDFFPFYRPNCLVTTPHQDAEFFVYVNEKEQFAAVIGEHLTKPYHMVEAYLKLLEVLKIHGISYVEMINDAADLVGTDCMLRAGFAPCAYFPAFKRHGRLRRDYVVLGKSFEYICQPALQLQSVVLEYYREYSKHEARIYFPHLT